ncbi:hypothetical protein [Sphingomonas sp. 3-13AW]|uniref:hypothetical protein n=1 Tax=Sphingomonas sp. 3-13AW TaxID=3050450 RepID=UPI003BB66CB2
MKDATVSADARALADRMVTDAVTAAYPDALVPAGTADGARAAYLRMTVASSYYSQYMRATDLGYGPDHEMTLAFLEIAASLSSSIGDQPTGLRSRPFHAARAG